MEKTDVVRLRPADELAVVNVMTTPCIHGGDSGFGFDAAGDNSGVMSAAVIRGGGPGDRGVES
jgi:hypothetical protein